MSFIRVDNEGAGGIRMSEPQRRKFLEERKRRQAAQRQIASKSTSSLSFNKRNAGKAEKEEEEAPYEPTNFSRISYINLEDSHARSDRPYSATVQPIKITGSKSETLAWLFSTYKQEIDIEDVLRQVQDRLSFQAPNKGQRPGGVDWLSMEKLKVEVFAPNKRLQAIRAAAAGRQPGGGSGGQGPLFSSNSPPLSASPTRPSPRGSVGESQRVRAQSARPASQGSKRQDQTVNMGMEAFSTEVRKLAKLYIGRKEHKFWEIAQAALDTLSDKHSNQVAPEVENLMMDGMILKSTNNRIVNMITSSASREVNMVLERLRFGHWSQDKVMSAVSDVYEASLKASDRRHIKQKKKEAAQRELQDRIRMMEGREARSSMLRRTSNTSSSSQQEAARAKEQQAKEQRKRDEEQRERDREAHRIAEEQRKAQEELARMRGKSPSKKSEVKHVVYVDPEAEKKKEAERKAKERKKRELERNQRWEDAALTVDHSKWDRRNMLNRVKILKGEEKERKPSLAENIKLAQYQSMAATGETGQHQVQMATQLPEGRDVYEIICERHGCLPSTQVFEALRRTKCDLSHLGLGPLGFKAFCESMNGNNTVTQLDLTGNALCHQAMSSVTAMLKVCRVLTSLDLSQNPCPSEGSFKDFIATLNPRNKVREASALKNLTLSKVKLTDKLVYSLAQALTYNRTLLRLDLSRNEITDVGAAFIGSLLVENVTLEELDLSWNNIKGPGCKHLASGMRESSSLSKFSLAWNGLEDEGGECMGMMLQSNVSLEELDLRACRLGACSCLVFAQGITVNKTLKILNLGCNPLGEEGGRMLMDCISRNDVLERMGLQESSFLNQKGDQIMLKTPADSIQVFNQDFPDGHYSLDLSRPLHRAVVLELCYREMTKDPPKGCRKVKWNGKKLGKMNSSLTELGWPEKMYVKGTLELDFTYVLDPDPEHYIDEEDMFMLKGELEPKLANPQDKLGLLRLFTRSHCFLCSQAAQLISCLEPGTKESMEGTIMMFSRLYDYENLPTFIEQGLAPSDRDFFLQTLGELRFFRSSNPTGYYNLNLGLPLHWSICMRLMDISRAEGYKAANWRNGKYDLTSFDVETFGPPQWMMKPPHSGWFQFHFTSMVIPDASKNLTQEGYQEFLKKVLEPFPPDRVETHGGSTVYIHEDVSLVDKETREVDRLREQSIFVVVTADQVADLVSHMVMPECRTQAAVVLFRRISNPKEYWKVMQKLDSLEQSQVAERLGLGNVFSSKHSTMRWRLDTTHPEHMSLAKNLVSAAQRDEFKQNWHNVVINGRKLKNRIVEGDTMWHLLTTEFYTPILDFDFCGPDMLIKIQEEEAARPKLRQRPHILAMPLKPRTDSEKAWLAKLTMEYANRGRLKRMRLLHPYWIFQNARKAGFPDGWIPYWAKLPTSKLRLHKRGLSLGLGSGLTAAIQQIENPDYDSATSVYSWAYLWDAYCAQVVRDEITYLPEGQSHLELLYNELEVKAKSISKSSNKAPGSLTFKDLYLGLGDICGSLIEKSELQALFVEFDYDELGYIEFPQFEAMVMTYEVLY